MGLSEALTLGIVLKLTDEASDKLKKASENASGLGKAAALLGGAAVAGVTVLAKGLWDAAQAAGEEELGIAKLGEAVKATGADWDTASAAIEDYLAAELKRTALDDGAGREAISRLTMMTNDYREALELMPLAQDLARAKGMDLATAAEIVGKVHEGNTSILKRYGIMVAEDADAEEALAMMQAQVAGQAEAYGKTFVGAQEKMSIAMGNLKETVGAYVINAATPMIDQLAVLAMDALPKVEAFIQNPLIPTLSTMYDWFQANIIPVLERLVRFIRDDVVPALDWLWQRIEPVLQAAKDLWDWLGKVGNSAGAGIPSVTTPEGETQRPFGFAQGGDFITRGPTMFLAGEAGAERVTVTPLGRDRGATGKAYTFIYNDYGGGNQTSAQDMSRELDYRYRMGL